MLSCPQEEGMALSGSEAASRSWYHRLAGIKGQQMTTRTGTNPIFSTYQRTPLDQGALGDTAIATAVGHNPFGMMETLVRETGLEVRELGHDGKGEHHVRVPDLPPVSRTRVSNIPKELCATAVVMAVSSSALWSRGSSGRC